MPFSMDTELAAVLAEAAPLMSNMSVAARGDALALRELSTASMAAFDAMVPESPNVHSVDYQIPVADGSTIMARWYVRDGEQPGSAVVYAHGGGMVLGSVETYHKFVAQNVAETGVPFLSVDYRLAPEHQGPTPVEDTFAAVQWLLSQADSLGVDPARIAIMGDSAGGGIAAGVAIAARDRGVTLAHQILIYPMLDDRNLVPDPFIEPFAGWTYDQNYTGWHALLGDSLGADDVSPLSAPARLTDFSGLAPAFIDVGELDIFREEDVAYAMNLSRAGVSCELHVRPGVNHGYDRIAAQSRLGRDSWADRLRVIGAL